MWYNLIVDAPTYFLISIELIIAINMTEVYSAIKEKIPQLAEMLMTLPDSGVLIHEKALLRLLKLPQGNTFGPRSALTHLMRGIEKGYCGNKKKDCTRTGYTIVDFGKEHGSSRICYQQFGDWEQFLAGKLDDNRTTSNEPRWFKAGETLTADHAWTEEGT